MKLRSRGVKRNEKPKTNIDIDELAQMAMEKMKDCLTSSSNSTKATPSLPEVLVFDKDNEIDTKDSNQTLINKNSKSDKPVLLSSSLDPGPLPQLYFDTEQSAATRFEETTCQKQQPYEETIFTSAALRSKRAIQKEKKAERAKFAGPNWFNMPAPEITPEIKNDLKIIQIRNSLDRSHYYKSSDWKKTLPKYFQMGTVVEDATDYYSARIPKRQRKRTIVEELLSDKQFKKYHTHKYSELQRKRTQQAMRRKSLKKKKK